jgi:formate/nitrite transporter FocA (FNT family)
MSVLGVVFTVLATIGGLIVGGVVLVSLLYRIVKSMYSTGED